MNDDEEGIPCFQMSGARRILEITGGATQIKYQIEVIENALAGNPGDVFSHSKALIETICKTILADRGENIPEKYNMEQLFTQAVSCLPLVPESHGDNTRVIGSIENTIKGLKDTVIGLGRLRNSVGSAAHGSDAFSPLLGRNHAEFTARVADALTLFLYEAHLGFPNIEGERRLIYEREEEFNDYIDSIYDSVLIFEGSYLPSDVLFKCDYTAYLNYHSGYFSQQEEDEKDSDELSNIGEGE